MHLTFPLAPKKCHFRGKTAILVHYVFICGVKNYWVRTHCIAITWQFAHAVAVLELYTALVLSHTNFTDRPIHSHTYLTNGIISIECNRLHTDSHSSHTDLFVNVANVSVNIMYFCLNVWYKCVFCASCKYIRCKSKTIEATLTHIQHSIHKTLTTYLATCPFSNSIKVVFKV